MKLYITLLIINFVLFALAQLNVWRPLSFDFLSWFNANYAGPILLVLTMWFVLKYISENKLPPTKDQINAFFYGKDYFSQIKNEYRYNLYSWAFYTISISLCYVTFSQ